MLIFVFPNLKHPRTIAEQPTRHPERNGSYSRGEVTHQATDKPRPWHRTYMLAALPFTVPSTGTGCSFTVLNIARFVLEVRSWRGLELELCALHGVATGGSREKHSFTATTHMQENIKMLQYIFR